MARFFTPAWLVRHLLAVIVTVGCLGLGFWQWNRANDGSMISWGYTFEWPLFALFAIALWVRELRTELRKSKGHSEASDEPPIASPFQQQRRDTPATESTGDSATDAYNRYLEWLSANPDRRPNEYPG